MLYRALELGQPGNERCPDRYSEASTLICPGCSRLSLQTSNQAVVIQLGVMPQGVGTGPGSVVWQAEEPYLPVVGSLGRRFDAVRVRNYLAGMPAQVILGVT